MSAIVLEIAIIFLLIVANGLFALAEIAVVSARRARLHQQAEQGDQGARTALELVREPTRFLSTVQIGITLVGILAGAFGGATIAEAIADYLARVPRLAPYGEAIGLGLVVVVIAYFSLVLGELLPKRLALGNPERLAARVARPMRFLAVLVGPLVHFLSFSTELLLRLIGIRPAVELPVTPEEIAILMEQGRTAGVIEGTEQDIAESALFLGKRRVGAFITPRTDIVWLNLDKPIEEIRDMILNSRHAFFPVARDNLDNVVGIVRGRDVLAQLVRGQTVDWQALIQKPLFLPESQTMLNVLHQFRQSGQHMALVLDEHGGVQGVITLTDLLEVLVGDLPAAGQAEDERVIRREDGSWLLDGRLPVNEFMELLDLRELPDRGVYETLGGFIMATLGQIPTAGQHFEFKGWRLEVVDMDGRRVGHVLATPLLPVTAGARTE